MSNALIAAVQSMQNDMRRMETVSQNMVNIATPGYKRAMPVANAFSEAMGAAAAAGPLAQPGGAPTLTSVLDLSPGPLKQTGKPWDLAIAGDGFFELDTPEGPAYTRAGDFRVDGRGRLVSQAGFAVQGMQGELLVNGGAGAAAVIDHSGRIVQDGATIGQIKLVRFDDPKALVKNAAGLLQASGKHSAATEAHPELQVGFLESSNVTPMREMVSMMETTRHFEAAQKLFQGYDEKLSSAIQKLGQF